MTVSRMDKVNNLILRTLSEIILNELQNAEIAPYFYTVTGVKCSPDMHSAIVYISVLGSPESSHQGFKMLCRSLKDIQRLFAPRLRMKFTPKLTLKYDETAQQANRIEQLLHDIHKND